MNLRVKWLFLSALVLVVLTQIVVLHWGLEAIFFVTWFLLALTVQHESRLSAVFGLVFLLICPFLLVSRKDMLAGQAANYAYLFLAIGVLVQLEELLLERFGWLNRKLDFSYLRHPLSLTFRQGWNAAVQAVGRQFTLASKPEPFRLVQIIGTAALGIAFLGTIILKEQLAISLSLLVSAVVFPFLIWGLRRVARGQRPAWLLRGVLAIVVLPLIVVLAVWLYNLLNTSSLARLKVSYDFIDHLGEVIHPIPPGEGEGLAAQDWTIDQVPHRVLYQPPSFVGSSRILYQVILASQSKLVFDVAMDPTSWNLVGDGVAFNVYIVADGITHQVFSTYIDPKHNIADRHWHPYTIDLNIYSGKLVTFIFETNVGPMGDFRNDWAGWGEPRLLQP